MNVWRRLIASGQMLARTRTAVAASAVAILLVAALGCGGSGETPTSSALENATTSEGAVTDPGGQSADVSVVDALSTQPLDLPHLGDVSFKVDDTVQAVSVPVSVLADTVVKLTDGRGITYELVVPAGAVTQRISITMRALTALSSSTVRGRLLGGVLLEPDGLQFAHPATLTVTGAGLTGSPQILTGDQDGTNIDLAEKAALSQGVAASLRHLSTDVIIDWDDVVSSESLSRAQAAAKSLIERAKAALKDPIKVTPPPSLSLECGDEVTEMLDQQLLDLWLRTADDPEGELVRALLSSAFEYSLLGLDGSAQAEAATKLLLREKARAEKLMQQYAGDREKLLAIVSYGLRVTKDLSLAGAHAESEALGSKVAAYVSSFVDVLIDDIKTKHQYKMMRPAVIVGKWANLLGFNTGRFDEAAIVQRIFAAMQFDVETTLTVNWPEQEWLLKSAAPLEFSQDPTTGNFVLTGGGSGTYVSYTGPESVPMAGPGFQVKVALADFDPCEGTATFVIDRHFADSEQYSIADDSVDSLSMVKMSWESVFESRLEDGDYRFPVTLQEGQAAIVSQSVDGTSPSGEVTGTLQITVTHNPK